MMYASRSLIVVLSLLGGLAEAGLLRGRASRIAFRFGGNSLKPRVLPSSPGRGGAAPQHGPAIANDLAPHSKPNQYTLTVAPGDWLRTSLQVLHKDGSGRFRHVPDVAKLSQQVERLGCDLTLVTQVHRPEDVAALNDAQQHLPFGCFVCEYPSRDFAKDGFLLMSRTPLPEDAVRFINLPRECAPERFPEWMRQLQSAQGIHCQLPISATAESSAFHLIAFNFDQLGPRIFEAQIERVAELLDSVTHLPMACVLTGGNDLPTEVPALRSLRDTRGMRQLWFNSLSPPYRSASILCTPQVACQGVELPPEVVLEGGPNDQPVKVLFKIDH